MPWRVGKSSKCGSSKPWGVFKKGSASPEYCHATEDGAMRQVRALYANTDEGKSLEVDGAISEELLVKEVKEGVNEKGYYYGGYVGGVTSFRDLDVARESQERLHEAYQLNDDFSMLSSNILYSEDIADKAAALSALANEYAERTKSMVDDPEESGESNGYEEKSAPPVEKPGVWQRIISRFVPAAATKEIGEHKFTADDFAFVPDSKRPETWRVLVSSTPGETDLVQLSKAVTELATHAKEYGMSPEQERFATDAILAQIEFVLMEGGGSENRMAVWKEAGGQYRWFAVYSNNLLDQDNPPETILDQSHQAFTYLVKEGEVPYPELWHWHIPGTRWGVADFLDYRDGFALAGGVVDPGCEKEAEALAGRTDVKVSHGMPRATIVRDPDNPSNIVFHLTKEISDLPDYAAANQATTFRVDLIKEANMPGLADVIKEKSEYLKGLGYSDAQIEEVKSRLGGLLKKEKEELQVKEGEAAAEVTEAAPPQQPSAVEQELEQARTARVELEAIKTEMAAAVKEVKEIVLDLKVIRDVQLAEVKEGTPRESASFIETMLQRGSPIGAPSARVDGRSTLAKSGPKEQADEIPQVTGIPILDQAFQGMAQASTHARQ